jgi:transcriptional regulator with XRE-family HTH domain
MRPNPRKSFGQKVRSLREKLGLSQEELGEIAALHRTYIGSIERGERNVSLENIRKIAEALQTSASKLLEGI